MRLITVAIARVNWAIHFFYIAYFIIKTINKKIKKMQLSIYHTRKLALIEAFFSSFWTKYVLV